VLRTKRYILGTASKIRKSLQRDKRIWRNINRQHYIIYQQEEQLSQIMKKSQDNKPLEFETEKGARKWASANIGN
jgi:hypothetical protein